MIKIDLTIHKESLKKDYMNTEMGLIIAEEILAQAYTDRMKEIESNNTLLEGEIANEGKNIDPEDDEKLHRLAQAIYAIRNSTFKDSVYKI